VAGVVFAWPGLAVHAQYDRAAIAAGEVWRALAGHWAHYSVDHLFWDVLAFAALGVACERRGRARFLACLVTSALAISASVWLLLPDMRIYRGLSGIDSALFTLLISDIWREARDRGQTGVQATALTCLGAFLAKTAFEMATGRNLFVTRMETAAVGVPLAHIVGAACGFLVGAGSRLVLRFRRPLQWSISTTSASPRAGFGW
jgi:rhomboid family GlyGly-CTERM serine protease